MWWYHSLGHGRKRGPAGLMPKKCTVKHYCEILQSGALERTEMTIKRGLPEGWICHAKNYEQEKKTVNHIFQINHVNHLLPRGCCPTVKMKCFKKNRISIR